MIMSIDTMYEYCHRVCSLLPSHEKMCTNNITLCNMDIWGTSVNVYLFL